MSSSSAEDWPPTLESRRFSLVALAPEHAEAVWPQLQDVHNLQLFERVYGWKCTSLEAFRLFCSKQIDNHLQKPSYTIIAKDTGKCVGWTVLYNFNTEIHSLEVAFFMEHSARIPFAPPSFHAICLQAFNVLGYQQIDYRWGAVRAKTNPKEQDAFGLTLMGVVDRQLFVRSDSDSDLYRVTESQWRAIVPAYEAFEIGSGASGQAVGLTNGKVV